MIGRRLVARARPNMVDLARAAAGARAFYRSTVQEGSEMLHELAKSR